MHHHYISSTIKHCLWHLILHIRYTSCQPTNLIKWLQNHQINKWDDWRWVYARVYTPELAALEGCGADVAAAVSALGLASSEGPSHWVLLSRHWVLASWWGNGGIDAAAVWSSERLFPEIADGKGSSLITGSNICMPPRKHLPSCKLPLLFWRIYSRKEGDRNAFLFTRCKLFQEHRLVAALILFRMAHSFLATLHSR